MFLRSGYGNANDGTCVTPDIMPQDLQCEIDTLAARCAQILNEQLVRPRPQDRYAHLPLAIIDSIFSIGIRYEIVQQVVERYCRHFNLHAHPKSVDNFPSRNQQQSVDEMIVAMKSMGIERFTAEVFVNRNRTAPTGGILKSEAVFHFAQVLQEHGINHLQDLSKVRRVEQVNGLDIVVLDQAFERAIRAVPGQGTGITLKYFLMLAGSVELIKPDRMIQRFLFDVLGRQPKDDEEAASLLTEATRKLKGEYPNLVPSLLDFAIWQHQRSAVNRMNEQDALS